MNSPAAVLSFDGAAAQFAPPTRSRLIRRHTKTLLFYGRIDNRADLTLQLQAAGVSDAELVFLAFERWGPSAPAHLLGDFSVILWDTHERRALLARDHLGISTLYLAHEPDRVIVDHELAPVLSQLRQVHVDEETVAGFLRGELENDERTLYREITRVPPGHVVVVDANGRTSHRYWTPASGTAIRYADDREYEEHCRELLTRSVACRVEEHGTAIALSGGLDSSALAVVAHRLVQPNNPPTLFSLVFPGCPETDEEPYIDAVGARVNVEPVKVRPASASVVTFSAWVQRWRDAPPLPSDAATMPLYREVSDRGIGVAFTGAGGDYLFCGTAFHYADLVRRGALLSVAREWRANARTAETSPSLTSFARAGLWPALPIGVKRALRPTARQMISARKGEAWITLPPSAGRDITAPRGGSFATEAIVRDLTSGMHSYFLQSASRSAASAGVELRYPLLDVRLVEFLLAVPEDQRRRDGVQKSLLRRALARELPDRIATRMTKADFSPVALATFDAAGDEFFSRLQLAERGWVDGQAVAAMYRRMRLRRAEGDPTYGYDVPSLWSVMALELWLRGGRFDGAPSV